MLLYKMKKIIILCIKYYDILKYYDIYVCINIMYVLMLKMF